LSDAALISAVFVGVLFGFYLMFLRPIQKEQEHHKKEIRDLKPGDSVLTTSGFIGMVKDIQVPESGRTRIYIQLADGVVFEAVASAIAQRIPPPAVEKAKSEQRGLAQ
jgi:preprotein translocase subunit YajC